jgi:hypothetical protein
MKIELRKQEDIERLERIAHELSFEYQIKGHVSIGMNGKVCFVIDRIERKQSAGVVP